MPNGLIRLVGTPREALVRRLAERRRQRVSAAVASATAATPWPAVPAPDYAPRATARMEAFDFGDDPLPGWSSPAPRRTGWERPC